jgi:hypothetical protein
MPPLTHTERDPPLPLVAVIGGCLITGIVSLVIAVSGFIATTGARARLPPGLSAYWGVPGVNALLPMLGFLLAGVLLITLAYHAWSRRPWAWGGLVLVGASATIGGVTLALAGGDVNTGARFAVPGLIVLAVTFQRTTRAYCGVTARTRESRRLAQS